MTGRAIIIVVVLAAVGSAASVARADMIDTSGMKPWEACALCHGLDGNSGMARFPKLAGQPVGYIVKQLTDFRAGRRTNDGAVMADNAGILAAGDIPAVARHFGAQPAPPPFAASARADPALGARLFREGKSDGAPACADCHLREADGPVVYPRITAQHPVYIAKQLRDFRDGRHANDPGGVMRRVAATLSNGEIDAVAHYAASQPRQIWRGQ